MKSQPILWVGFFILWALLTAPVSAADEPIATPGKFKVSYSLKKQSSGSGGSGGVMGAGAYSGGATQADLAVNILDARFFPVKAFVVKGVSLQDRVDSLWDGRNAYGKEMPAGNYYAQMSILYSDGTRETKLFKFTKD